jgi:hypothetical protein
MTGRICSTGRKMWRRTISNPLLGPDRLPDRLHAPEGVLDDFKRALSRIATDLRVGLRDFGQLRRHLAPEGADGDAREGRGLARLRGVERRPDQYRDVRLREGFDRSTSPRSAS